MRQTPIAGALVLLACAAGPAGSETRGRAVTSGWADDGDDAVVGLLFGDLVFCTGTLIAPALVLTAGHCLATMGPTDVLFGSSVDVDHERVAVASIELHPDYDPDGLQADLGIVLLERRAAPAPIPLLREPFDDELVGAPIRFVGFGLSSADDPEPGRKRMGTSVIRDFDETRFTFEAAPNQTCMGDSGGPTFVVHEGDEWLAGVHSFGDRECEGIATDTRVDVYAADFIEPYLAAATPEAPGGELVGHCAATPAPRRPNAGGLVLVAALAAATLRPRKASRCSRP